MAERAHKILHTPVLRSYEVSATAPVRVGFPARFGASDDEVADINPAAPDDFIGIVLPHSKAHPVTKVVPPRERVEVIHPFPIVPMRVGTGGATRGARLKVVVDGVTNAAPNGGGTNPESLVGIAMQSGVLGDEIGVGLVFGARSKA